MRTSIVIILIFAATLTLGASDGLIIRPYWEAGNPNLLQDRPLAADVQARVILHFENTGTDSIRVPRKTKALLWIWGDYRDQGIMLYRFGYEYAAAGRRSLPSPADLDIIELRAGEMSEVWCNVTIPRGVKIAFVSLEYLVEEPLGRRYGTWFGRKVVPVAKQGMPARDASSSR
jgi:hypothetical protein